MSDSDNTQSLAAIDLGSNSFHMIVGRLQNGQLQLIDRLREPVRLAAGLDDDQQLYPEVAGRALDCLRRFGQRVHELKPGSVRAVGTNTLRLARISNGFIEQAQEALGHSIEVISGIEEARLIHLGVAHSLADPGGQRLVVDIGGGSTELIIGEGFHPIYLESLYMGCVNISQRFFAKGVISKKAMKEAILAARLELQASREILCRLGWSMATGSSGTIRTVRDVVRESGWSDSGITADSLKQLRNSLIDIGQSEEIDFPAVNENRRPVFAAGVAVLSAVFQALKIDRMQYSSGALREGLLYDLLGRIQHKDIREATVQSLAQRYHVDLEQAQRVETTAVVLGNQLARQWQLHREDIDQWLHWAALLHETGLVIAHSQYHKHGAYLIEYSDLAGFSLLDQRFLSILIHSHRRKFRKSLVEALPGDRQEKAICLAILLRLSVLLHRNRSQNENPDIKVSAAEQSIQLEFPQGWLEEHPLTLADLDEEKKFLKPVSIKLEYS
ncbi:MAG TPA: exopolyphosphatase [Gammaproteobacteria bacterium]|nr:exopolyphosphatase [Gammaproteobacteria bacterium]